MTNEMKGGATVIVDDGHMIANPTFGPKKPDLQRLGPADKKTIPHNMDSDVTTTPLMEKLKCPQCGKSTLHAEFPDQYEVWAKCSSCNFFMGMGVDEWHRMENSPNMNEKLKKMARKKELIGLS